MKERFGQNARIVRPDYHYKTGLGNLVEAKGLTAQRGTGEACRGTPRGWCVLWEEQRSFPEFPPRGLLKDDVRGRVLF